MIRETFTRHRAGVLTATVAALLMTGCSTVGKESSDDSSASAAELPAACAYSSELDIPSEVPQPDNADLKIGYINPIGSNEASNATQDAAEQTVERLGGKIVTYDAKGQPEVQVQEFDQLLNQGVDAIVVPFPLDPLALKPMLARAEAEDVPVIALEGYANPAEPVDGYASNMLLGRDQQGFVEASEMAKKHPGSEVLLVKFAVPVPGLEYVTERTAYWADKCGLDVVETVANPSDDAAGAQTVVTPALQAHPDVKGILAYNDPTAVGAAAAARTLGRSVTVFGMNGASDGYNAVKDGTIDLSIQTPQVQYGAVMVEAAYAAVQDLDVPPVVLHDPPYYLLTSQTIDSGEAKTYDQHLEELSNK